MGRNGRFSRCWESFVPVELMYAVCWESFVPWVCAARLVSGGLREKVLPARVVCVPTVTIFSLLASKGPKWAFFAMLGEFCTGCGHAYRVRGEFCTVGVRCVASGWWFAGKSSPCLGCLRLHREKVLPARLEWAESGVICCAGRVLYRGVCAAWLVSGGLREKILPARVVCVCTGKKFSLLASNGPKWAVFPVLGEFCTGECALRGW